MKNILILILLAVLGYSCSKDQDIYPPTDSEMAEIQGFRLVTEAGSSAAASININSEQATITITPNAGVDLSRLFPSATISEGAIVQPALGVYADFTSPVEYTVIAGNRQVQKVWTVRVVQ